MLSGVAFVLYKANFYNLLSLLNLELVKHEIEKKMYVNKYLVT